MERYLHKTASAQQLTKDSSDQSKTSTHYAVANEEDVELADTLRNATLATNLNKLGHCHKKVGRALDDTDHNVIGCSPQAACNRSIDEVSNEDQSIYDEETIAADEMILPERGLYSSAMTESKMSIYEEMTIVGDEEMTLPQRGLTKSGVTESKMSMYEEMTIVEVSSEGSVSVIDEEIIEEEEDVEIMEEDVVMDDEDDGSAESETDYNSNKGPDDDGANCSQGMNGKDEEQDEECGFMLNIKQSNRARFSDITVDFGALEDQYDSDSNDFDADGEYVPSEGETGYCIKFKEGNFRSSMVTTGLGSSNSSGSGSRGSVPRKVFSRPSTRPSTFIKPLAMVSEGASHDDTQLDVHEKSVLTMRENKMESPVGPGTAADGSKSAEKINNAPAVAASITPDLSMQTPMSKGSTASNKRSATKSAPSFVPKGPKNSNTTTASKAKVPEASKKATFASSGPVSQRNEPKEDIIPGSTFTRKAGARKSKLFDMWEHKSKSPEAPSIVTRKNHATGAANKPLQIGVEGSAGNPLFTKGSANTTSPTVPTKGYVNKSTASYVSKGSDLSKGSAHKTASSVVPSGSEISKGSAQKAVPSYVTKRSSGMPEASTSNHSPVTSTKGSMSKTVPPYVSKGSDLSKGSDGKLRPPVQKTNTQKNELFSMWEEKTISK